jgi:hypothetical protein
MVSTFQLTRSIRLTDAPKTLRKPKTDEWSPLPRQALHHRPSKLLCAFAPLREIFVFLAFFRGFNSWPEGIVLQEEPWGEAVVVLRFCARYPGAPIFDAVGKQPLCRDFRSIPR